MHESILGSDSNGTNLNLVVMLPFRVSTQPLASFSRWVRKSTGYELLLSLLSIMIHVLYGPVILGKQDNGPKTAWKQV